MILRERFVFNFHYNYGADAIIRSFYSGIFKLPLTDLYESRGLHKNNVCIFGHKSHVFGDILISLCKIKVNICALFSFGICAK